MADGTVHYERLGRLALITLDRPDRLNALNRHMLDCLDAAVASAEADREVCALVVTGKGNFSAGADIGELTTLADQGAARAYLGRFRQVFERLANLQWLTVAAVAGPALGGGCELALTCDLRVADETASFGLPEVRLGILPGAGGTQRLPRLIGMAKAKEMLLLGARLTAAEALQCGLINRVSAVGQALDAALELAARCAELPPLAIAVIKRVVNRGIEAGLETGLALESEGIAALVSTEDFREGARAFLEKRQSQFRGR